VEPEIEVLLRVGLTITSNQADAEDLVRNTNSNMHRRQRPGAIGDWELIRTARPAFGTAELPSAEDSFVHEELHADLDAAVRALDPRFRAARRIQRYLDADPAAPLTPGEISRLERHLATCEKCTQVATEHRALHRALSLWSGGTGVDPRSVDRVCDFLSTINDEDPT